MTEHDPLHEDDLALSRLLDDDLTEEEATTLRRRLAQEPALAQRLDELRGSDEAVRAVYGDIADEPLPAAVTDLLTARVAPAPRPAPADAPIPFRPPAAPAPRVTLAGVLTSAAALAAGFLIAFLFIPRASGPQGMQGPPGLIAGGGVVAERSALYETLQTTASSESKSLGAGWSATPRLTFVNVEGDPCRRVDLSSEQSGLAALACRTDGAWRVELMAFQAAAGSSTGGGYTPASGGGADRIDRAIDDLIDGDPLGRDAERALIDEGWKLD